MNSASLNRSKACILGLAIGDAVGASVEFRARGSFEPVTDMTGGGKFQLDAGQWTDDTSMALCLAQSLIDCKGFDAADQMEKYIRWFDEGYYSCKSKGFGLGKTIGRAIGRYIKSGDPYQGDPNPSASGNGALMRIAPIAIYYQDDLQEVLHYGESMTRTTHGSSECLDSSQLFLSMLNKALSGCEKNSILQTSIQTGSSSIENICNQTYLNKSESEIKGSGYVVEGLEAAIWCFATTTSFKGAILKAVNLGDDADTTAAICGQLAGAYYGFEDLPQDWLNKLYLKDEIILLVETLFKNRN